MLLVIDVGNTQTVLGVYDGDELKHMWRIATGKADTADELRIRVLSLLRVEEIDPVCIEGSAIASVVPSLSTAWRQALSRLIGSEPITCSALTAQELFEADYPNASEIGADRVADAVAARFIYGAPVVVVDFGTATNVEVIDQNGRFVGGIIAPGLETSAAALFSHATKLPAIELSDPGSAIGKSTVHAMRSGIVYGEADRVDGFVNRIFDELGCEATVVATGGLATTMAPLCKTITHVNSKLTLEGLRLVYDAAKR